MQDISTSRDHIRATTVNGTDVYNTQGDHLGHVDDVVLSKTKGNAVYAIMSFGGFLGMGEKYHPLPWQSLTYDEGKGGYVVNVTREQLEGAPAYASGDEPDWNDPAYGGQLSRHYGFPYS